MMKFMVCFWYIWQFPQIAFVLLNDIIKRQQRITKKKTLITFQYYLINCIIFEINKIQSNSFFFQFSSTNATGTFDKRKEHRKKNKKRTCSRWCHGGIKNRTAWRLINNRSESVRAIIRSLRGRLIFLWTPQRGLNGITGMKLVRNWPALCILIIVGLF